MAAPRHLTDDDLISTIASIAATERMATGTLVAHLCELESRNLHLAQGFRAAMAGRADDSFRNALESDAP